MNVRAAQHKICSETEVIFNSDFWQSVDVVATALVSAAYSPVLIIVLDYSYLLECIEIVIEIQFV